MKTDMKMHKAIKVLNSNSLSVVSTERQMKNGTIMVMDDVLGDEYTIHASGYVRSRAGYTPEYRGMTGMLEHYQLNPVRKEIGKYFVFKERILFPGDYEKLANIVVRVANKRRLKKG